MPTRAAPSGMRLRPDAPARANFYSARAAPLPEEAAGFMLGGLGGLGGLAARVVGCGLAAWVGLVAWVVGCGLGGGLGE